MDKKFGAPWHVVAGGYFSYDITFEVCSSLYTWLEQQCCKFLLLLSTYVRFNATAMPAVQESAVYLSWRHHRSSLMEDVVEGGALFEWRP